MNDLDNSLTRYLQEAGETLSSLASRMGRHPSTLTRLMRGERSPSLALARDVERATGGKVTAVEFIEIFITPADTASTPEPAQP